MDDDIFAKEKGGIAENPSAGVTGAAAPAGTGGSEVGIGRDCRVDPDDLDSEGDREGPGKGGLDGLDGNEEV